MVPIRAASEKLGEMNLAHVEVEKSIKIVVETDRIIIKS